MTFNYEVLNDLDPDDGVVYNIIWLIKMVGMMIWFRVMLGVLNLIFRSSILTSPIGLALTVGAAVLVTAVNEGISI